MTSEKADISEGKGISAIWIIPLLALALGIYMVIHNWLTEGPEIDITFNTANGLVAGKTKVKYRNVEMGVVETVRMSDDLEKVIAQVKLDRQVLPLLREDTRFWVVTARVGLGNISGLDTLLSGAYIQLAPGKGKKGARHFTAQEQPPLTPTGAAGLRLKLTSDHTSSVSTGDPVLYKGYLVGRVESMEFDVKVRKARYVVFIDAPFHELVNSATRFWDVSGVSLSAGADGLKIDTGALDSILLGGVTFGVPEGVSDGDPVEHNTEFRLFASLEETLENPFRFGLHYVVSFTQSVKGLLPGAPVEYRGLTVGKVEKILLKESTAVNMEAGGSSTGDPIPVLIYLEPGLMELPDEESSVEYMRNNIALAVSKGLRATLQSSSLLTGAKLISVDYYPDNEQRTIGRFLDYPTIPTIETGLGQLEYKLSAILDKVNNLPLEDTVDSANKAIARLDDTLNSLNGIVESQGMQQLPKQLDKTLRELRDTLEGFSPGSDVYQSINSSLLRLNRTLANLETMSETLANQPNAVLLPSDSRLDPIPEASQ